MRSCCFFCFDLEHGKVFYNFFYIPLLFLLFALLKLKNIAMIVLSNNYINSANLYNVKIYDDY
jgi:hypothetical protein